MPEFTKGDILSYLRKTISYPVLPDSCSSVGTMYISFIVSKTGEVKDLRVKASGCSELEEYIEKQLADIPAWKPGRNNGQPVDVQITVPVKICPR